MNYFYSLLGYGWESLEASGLNSGNIGAEEGMPDSLGVDYQAHSLENLKLSVLSGNGFFVIIKPEG